MLTQHDALYHLYTSAGDSLVDQFNRPFDAVSYSRFKHGYTPPADLYAKGLADVLARHHREQLLDPRPLVVISAPYVWIPTASHAIVTRLVRHLDAYRRRYGLSPVTIARFSKHAMGSDRYAMATADERQQLLARMQLTIDHNAVHSANLLVVDDIRVTGGAEATTATAIEPHNPHSVVYLHAARLEDRLGQARSHLESELNQTFATSRTTVLRDIQANEFELNTRVNRVLLTVRDAADSVELSRFLSACPTELLHDMSVGVVAGGPEYIARLQAGFNILEATLAARLRGSQTKETVQL
jgi:hypothetical protein